MTLGEKPRPSKDGTLLEGACLCWGAFLWVWGDGEEAVFEVFPEDVAGTGLLACGNEKIGTANRHETARTRALKRLGFMMRYNLSDAPEQVISLG